jgi:hypothetical protein
VPDDVLEIHGGKLSAKPCDCSTSTS